MDQYLSSRRKVLSRVIATFASGVVEVEAAVDMAEASEEWEANPCVRVGEVFG